MNFSLIKMGTRPVSDLFSYSVYVFDLDNTIIREEEYLFQAYETIAARLAMTFPLHNPGELDKTLKTIFLREGRTALFNKFLTSTGIGEGYLEVCLDILRSYTPENPLSLIQKTKQLLIELIRRNKKIFVLTNGNPVQQRNKVRYTDWNGLDKNITFIFAEEIKPKPSPDGLILIIRSSGTEKREVLMIGDSPADKECAVAAGTDYIDISEIEYMQ